MEKKQKRLNGLPCEHYNDCKDEAKMFLLCYYGEVNGALCATVKGEDRVKCRQLNQMNPGPLTPKGEYLR